MDVLIRRKKSWMVHLYIFPYSFLLFWFAKPRIHHCGVSRKKKNIPEAVETLNKKSVSAEMDVE